MDEKSLPIGAATAGRKVLVLALDAAEPALLRTWMDDGTLPNLARLEAGGLSAITRGVDALYVGATWPSFSTGRSPGGHGIYWLNQHIAGTYRTRAVTQQDFARTPTLWDVLSAAGKRVAVLDVPLTRCTPGLNGLQVVEWGVHDAAFGFTTEPAWLAPEILRTVGPHPAPTACDRPRRSRAEYRAFADQLIQGAAARAKLTQAILAREPWDFCIQVFSETHCSGHQLWHYHDAEHPAFDPALVAADGDLVRDVYVAVDQAIGEITQALSSEYTIIVMSLHGMGCMAGAGRLTDEILARLDAVASANDTPTGNQDAPSLRTLLTRAARRAYHLVPQALRRPLYEARQRLNEQAGRGVPLPIDPSRSRAFRCEMGPAVTGIRLNQRGREPQGLLAPGAESDAYCAWLTSELLQLVETTTKSPLVARVLRTADHFPGLYLPELPDLLVEWSLSRPLGSTVLGRGQGARLEATSASIGTVAFENSYCRSGEHRVQGMLIVNGTSVPPTRLAREVSSLELAPAIAALLGTRMTPADGQPQPELVSG
jgi:predicted AlkP superfamily phosphohydrolase/phosphomutase